MENMLLYANLKKNIEQLKSSEQRTGSNIILSDNEPANQNENDYWLQEYEIQEGMK